MLLDASVVSRSDLVRAPRHKEWWYVGWVDDSRTVYTSFHAIRLPPVDNVVFTVFDLAAGRPVARSRKLFLTAPAGLDHTELRADSRRGQVHYSGSSEAGWSLRFSDGGVEADVMIRPTAPPFIKKENQFAHQYSMVSSMHTAVRGSVGADGREYAFTDALGYADHCSGHLPRRTGWLALWLLVKGVKATGSGIDVLPATPAAIASSDGPSN
ncbi:hypothetical protein H5398_14810 [Tessaracoccus sp. MC1679]|uniref:hypothetical protein n=1 Tax=Tessaracoccus sp. MC1679 TaxID=2760313 RepID=UPI0016005651|nr:hypothetical protein [Tessaracoccus sp. MC1679]MBB1517225.1 hypothetical protein [Tessaracoccus sp. MC1679]